jgi:hypothetical protein
MCVLLLCKTYILAADLRSWEQREQCKILIRLAVDEPGCKWIDETFRHERGI